MDTFYRSYVHEFPQPTLFPIFSGRLPKRREDLEVRSAHLHALTWEQRKLGEMFIESEDRSSDLEILSVSVVSGIYPASESDRETNPGASLSSYKIVRKGDVVYNSMRMWQGAVDSSRYDGIVSPAYVVARPTAMAIPRFFARLLKRPELLRQYQRLSQGNSKDTQVLKFDEFAGIQVRVPLLLEEQEAIGAIADALDSLIALHQRERLSTR